MFRKIVSDLLVAVVGQGQKPKPISLRLTCLSLAEGGTAANLGWEQQGAPQGVIFDVDFQGEPSGVTTGFLWDGAAPILKGVFVPAGDTAFRVTKAFAYARTTHDASGRVGLGWSLTPGGGGTLILDAGKTLTLELDFDPSIKAIRKV